MKFNSDIKNGIACFGFSPNSRYLVAVGKDQDHSVALYDLQKHKLCCKVVSGDTTDIFAVTFIDPNNFVSVGMKHYKFWSFNEQSPLKNKKGSFGNFASNSGNVLLCVAFKADFIFTGSANGSVHKWQTTSVKCSQKIHQKAVDAIVISNSQVVTGAKDGLVIISDLNIQPLN